MSLLARALADAWSLIAPVECAGCGAADRALCSECAATLHPRLQQATLQLDARRSALPVLAALDYGGVCRQVILALKESGRTELARPLAPALLAAVDAAWQGADLLVPVPASAAGFARRGFEPVVLLARRAGLEVTRALTARLAARDAGGQQKSRTLEQRRTIDEHRWVASPRVRGRRVVLIDDVVTSGSTLRAAARALDEAGAEVVGCAAIAATARRVGTSSIPWKELSTDPGARDDNGRREDYREAKEGVSPAWPQAAR